VVKPDTGNKDDARRSFWKSPLVNTPPAKQSNHPLAVSSCEYSVAQRPCSEREGGLPDCRAFGDAKHQSARHQKKKRNAAIAGRR
jgi:hypothetical protein